MSFKKKNIIITGSTKGLGKELAIEFDKQGANIILIGRSKDLLNQLKKKLNNSKNHLFLNGDMLYKNHPTYIHHRLLRSIKNQTFHSY